MQINSAATSCDTSPACTSQPPLIRFHRTIVQPKLNYIDTIVTTSERDLHRATQALCNSIAKHAVACKLVVYDFGLSRTQAASLKDYGCEIVSSFPRSANGLLQGRHASKILAISDYAARKTGPFVWVDPGLELSDNPANLFTAIGKFGLVVRRLAVTAGEWMDERLSQYFGVEPCDSIYPVCSAAVIGLDPRIPSVDSLVLEWRQYATNPYPEWLKDNGRIRYTPNQAILTSLVLRLERNGAIRHGDYPHDLTSYTNVFTSEFPGADLLPRVEGLPLRRLFLIPQGGLGNRLRAIASANRVCRMTYARCFVIWNPSRYYSLFAHDPNIEVIAAIPADSGPLRRMSTALDRHGGNSKNRKVPVTGWENIVLRTCHSFCSSGEECIKEWDLRDFFPAPCLGLEAEVKQWADRYSLHDALGVHIRRTDNRRAIQQSPDDAFHKMIEDIGGNFDSYFLATDNAQTEANFRDRYGEKVVSLPKFNTRKRRWPRNMDAIEDWRLDYLDLLLLASCRVVVGSRGSSYSQIAMILNGSAACRHA